ncbi:MAG: 23S rRNA (adenine(2030)-N(6))-methyltransferase RlmJ [Rubrivivax sp.]|nr:23S rRNA (adenine(2030)-N(6))-methyltransferase RlmJ [Rubrivivax sp.]
MLAYRHAFHAGNHADVLKHLVLMLVLQHLNQKDKGWRYVDTHAGAGGYALDGDYATQKAEAAQGIGRLWARDDLPPAVADYVGLVRSLNAPGGPLKQYPGSPLIAQALMRPQDQLRLFELHPTDHRILASAFDGDASVETRMADGFDGCKALLPPPTRRGLVMIDPAYEGERDYARVVSTLRDALGRFADGSYLVWYPQVGKLGARELPRRLQALAPKGWLHARLTLAAPQGQGYGMVGSGVFLINPPYTLHAQLQRLLPWLAQALSQIDEPQWLLDQRAV